MLRSAANRPAGGLCGWRACAPSPRFSSGYFRFLPVRWTLCPVSWTESPESRTQSPESWTESPVSRGQIRAPHRTLCPVSGARDLAPASSPAGDQTGRLERFQVPAHRSLVHLGLSRDRLNRGERVRARVVVVMVGERQKHELRHGRAHALPEGPGDRAHTHRTNPERFWQVARNSRPVRRAGNSLSA